jgi:hypothetical protein
MRHDLFSPRICRTMQQERTWNICQMVQYDLRFLRVRNEKFKTVQVLLKANRLLSFDTTWTAKKTMPPTFLRCCVNVFTEPLPRNDKGYTVQSSPVQSIGAGPRNRVALGSESSEPHFGATYTKIGDTQTPRLFFHRHGQHRKRVQQLFRVFVAAGTFYLAVA